MEHPRASGKRHASNIHPHLEIYSLTSIRVKLRVFLDCRERRISKFINGITFLRLRGEGGKMIMRREGKGEFPGRMKKYEVLGNLTPLEFFVPFSSRLLVLPPLLSLSLSLSFSLSISHTAGFRESQFTIIVRPGGMRKT